MYIDADNTQPKGMWITAVTTEGYATTTTEGYVVLKLFTTEGFANYWCLCTDLRSVLSNRSMCNQKNLWLERWMSILLRIYRCATKSDGWAMDEYSSSNLPMCNQKRWMSNGWVCFFESTDVQQKRWMSNGWAIDKCVDVDNVPWSGVKNSIWQKSDFCGIDFLSHVSSTQTYVIHRTYEF